MMYSMSYLFSLQVFEKLDLEVLEFWLISELAILEWFLTWNFKHVIILVFAYYGKNINHLYHIFILCHTLQYLGFGVVSES